MRLRKVMLHTSFPLGGTHALTAPRRYAARRLSNFAHPGICQTQLTTENTPDLGVLGWAHDAQNIELDAVALDVCGPVWSPLATRNY